MSSDFLSSLSGLFRNSSSKSPKKIFLEGWEVKLNGDQQCYRFLETQAISEELALTSTDALELVFEDNRLVEKYNWQYGDRSKLELDESESAFQYYPVTPNEMYLVNQTDSGFSHLGGELPEGFKLPKFDSKPSFQYLGTLSPQTSGLEWLPFDFNLTVPIYGSFTQLFIDYSDPTSPKVLNESDYLNSDYEDERVKHDSELIFEKVFISSEKLEEMPEILHGIAGILGIPEWIQNPDIPKCPKSGKTMKFVIQLGFGLEVGLQRTNIELPEEGYFADLLGRMNFWADGNLFVFLNPDTKMACYLIQI